MSTSPRPELAAVPACPHGALGDVEREARGLAAVVDFSVNGNPLGAPPGVAEAAATAAATRYPDDGCRQLRRALAEHAGVSAEQVLVGNGSSELIWLLASAYLRPEDNVLLVGPTFGEYARAAAIQGARAVEYRAQEGSSFRPDLDDILALARRLRPRLLFVCNPNNPTGVYLRRDEMRRLLAGCEDGLLVVDEAYLSFVEAAESLVGLLDEGVVLLRSMTKDYALAGLRLGYALAAYEVIQALATVRPPWSVNAPAQAAGLAAFTPAGEAHLTRSRTAVFEAKAYLREALGSLGLAAIVPSATNLLLVRVGEATAFRSALLARGYCVRDCTSFGLPDYIRIGMRPLPECRGLVAAVREVLGGG
ncbi:MAG: pyridoxal phosphate-dependent aminotransferase [Chloroflexota bacterium]